MKILALLRGINVGGNSIIKMAALKACFEELGLIDVSTYIQSGNVIFTSKKSLETLTEELEKAIEDTFKVSSKVVLITQPMLEEVLREAPKNFGQEPGKYRYDVIFTKPPLTPKEAFPQIPSKDGVDHLNAGTHALYFSRLISKASQSHLPRLIKLPLYKRVTIRNWNTTTKLVNLMQSHEKV